MHVAYRRSFLIAALLLIFNDTSSAAGDPVRGAQAFQQCAACHSIKPGEHLTGPSLAHVWDRKAGTATGFPRYSDALKRSGLTWNAKTLDAWLADPQHLVPGNAMTFPGIRNAGQRQDVIAYLQSVSEGKAPADGAQQGRGMMMGRSARVDLKQADAAAQVVSLTHCRDTYVVKTANGATHKIWEFNLRLKTDTSAYGPAPGKPVVTGAGMMGDRAAIVFAAPAEISAYIKESCD